MHVHYGPYPMSLPEFLVIQLNRMKIINQRQAVVENVIGEMGHLMALSVEVCITTNEENIWFQWSKSAEERVGAIKQTQRLLKRVRQGVKRVQFKEALILHSDARSILVEPCDAPCFVMQELGE